MFGRGGRKNRTRIEPRLEWRSDRGGDDDLRADPADRPPSARRKAAAKANRAGKSRQKPRRSPLRGLLYWTVVLGVWALIAFGGLIAYNASQLPPIDQLAVPKRPPNIAVLADDGSLIANRGDTGGPAVRLIDLPPYLPKAFVAIEDKRFYWHFGIDPLGISRAVLRDATGKGAVEGGSTLTQQLAKNLFLTQERTISRKIQAQARQLDYFPEELEGIDAMLSDTYFCNFSLFQSMPDSWAIKQLFPIMPIHRLEEQPSRPAVLGDITCDSDGKVDAFIDRRDVKRTLQLHTFDGGNYYLGAFLLGAYQEILGDMHNLFGDTNAVHVRLGPTGEVMLDSVIKGDTVREVLDYVQFKSDWLVTRLRRDVEAALREGRLSYEESGALLKFYEEGLHGYTYLEDVHEQ